jgi:hypothetical protein
VPRWAWTHVAAVVVDSMHHEEKDSDGKPGMDVAVLRLSHDIVATAPPGAEGSGGTGGDHPIGAGTVGAGGLGASLGGSGAPGKTPATPLGARRAHQGTVLTLAPVVPHTTFAAAPLAHSDQVAVGDEVYLLAYGKDEEASPTTVPMVVVRQRSGVGTWLFATPDSISTRNVPMSGGPVFWRQQLVRTHVFEPAISRHPTQAPPSHTVDNDARVQVPESMSRTQPPTHAYSNTRSAWPSPAMCLGRRPATTDSSPRGRPTPRPGEAHPASLMRWCRDGKAFDPRQCWLRSLLKPCNASRQASRSCSPGRHFPW